MQLVNAQDSYLVPVEPIGTLSSTLCDKGDLPIVNDKLNPQIFADADYANGSDSRRSITGSDLITYLLAGANISWQSYQQKSLALSTMEAENMAAYAAT